MISDRIAIMNFGEIQQIASPEEIYSRPANVFVSTFIGHSNIFDGNILQEGSTVYIKFNNNYKVIVDNIINETVNGQKIKISVRAEEFIISGKNEGIKGKVKLKHFLGKYTNYEVELEDKKIVELTQDINNSKKMYEIGEDIHLEVNNKRINIFDETGNKSLIIGVKCYEN